MGTRFFATFSWEEMLRLSVRPMFGTREGGRYVKGLQKRLFQALFVIRPDYLERGRPTYGKGGLCPDLGMKREGHTQQGKKGGKGRRRPWMEEEEEESCKRNLRRKRQKREREGWFVPPSRKRERERVMLRPTKRISETSHLFKDDGEGGSREFLCCQQGGRICRSEIGGEERYHSTQHTRYVRHFLKPCQVL